jgi:hypothetical protein
VDAINKCTKQNAPRLTFWRAARTCADPTCPSPIPKLRRRRCGAKAARRRSTATEVLAGPAPAGGAHHADASALASFSCLSSHESERLQLPRPSPPTFPAVAPGGGVHFVVKDERWWLGLV